MKTVKDLKKMISEPASKEWFKNHGMPKSQALRSSKKVVLKQPRKLTTEESKSKTKHWPSSGKEPTGKEKSDYQRRIGRGYNE